MNGDESRLPADDTAEADGEPSRSPPSDSGSDGLDAPDTDAVDPAFHSPSERHPPTSVSTNRPPPVRSANDADETRVGRLMRADSGGLLLLRETLTSVLAVTAVGLLLFAVSGVWPPMVAVESGSMEPHMHKGDLVFITEPGRYMPDETYAETGIVPAETAAETGYRTFGEYGSVVVYDNPGVGGSPIIHRAHFWVEAGENWYDRANPDYVRADNCAELNYCPAPHAGFITKGDNNARYDQASDISEPVRAEWVTGIARVRVPLLGWIRLSIATAGGPVVPAQSPAVSGSIVAADHPKNATVYEPTTRHEPITPGVV